MLRIRVNFCPLILNCTEIFAIHCAAYESESLFSLVLHNLGLKFLKANFKKLVANSSESLPNLELRIYDFINEYFFFNQQTVLDQ